MANKIDVSDKFVGSDVPVAAGLGTGEDILNASSDANLPALTNLKTAELPKIVDTIEIDSHHKDQAVAMGSEFNFHDTNEVMLFGADPQRAYLESLKSLIAGRKMNQLGDAKDIIFKIQKGINIANIEGMKDALNSGGGFMGKVGSFFGFAKDLVAVYLANQEKIESLVEEIEADINRNMHKIMTNNARLDVMTEAIEMNFYQLGVYIYAGEVALDRGRDEYEELRQKAASSGDSLQIAKLNNFREQVVAFDSRLLLIKKAYVEAPITFQKIQTTQQAGRIQINTHMNALLFALPKFLESMHLIVSLMDLKKAQEDEDALYEMNAQLEELEGNLLGEIAVKAKESQNRGARQVVLVEAAANKLLETCKSIQELDETQAEERKEDEGFLVQIQSSFKNTLADVNAKGVLS
jgi:uncharacterized protein YaaN involved in tellurite resistance